jgi:HEAT repeat protein
MPQARASAAQALASAAPEDPETRVLLNRALHEQPGFVRLGAARGLWELKAPAQQVLPVLVALLNHKLASVRAGALKGIAEMGTAARQSRFELEPLTRDESETVRHSAAVALKSVVGQTHRTPDSSNQTPQGGGG